jgi:predicted dehydrogenase
MKIGILGLGSIGKRHANNLRMLGHDVGAFDVDTKAFNGTGIKFLERENLLKWADAIVIATPTAQHYDDWGDCLSGSPIFIEKPLSGGSLDEWDLANIRPVSVGYNLRFHPCVKAACAWLSAGHIGIPIWAQFTVGQFNDKPAYLRDGVVLNWSHEIDLALYLFGPAKVVASSVRLTDGKDDIADFVLQHDSGARSTIHLDYVTKNEIREAWIVGTEKNIGMDLLGRRNSMGKVIQEFGGKWDDDYLDEISEWVKKITPTPPAIIKEASPLATGEDGLRVLEICHQVKQIAGIE